MAARLVGGPAPVTLPVTDGKRSARSLCCLRQLVRERPRVTQLAAHPVNTGSMANTNPRTHAFSRSCRHCGSSMPVRTAGDQLLADYLDYMRRNAGDERTPHATPPQEYCTTRNLP